MFSSLITGAVGRRLRNGALAVLFSASLACFAQERPYFVTYSHELEEPGNLEIATKNVVGKPDGGNRFMGSVLEMEYGATTWWTTELYLSGQSTKNDSTIFTGFRWENRFRPLLREHWINPVLYVEYENTSADKALLEVVGHDGKADFAESNADRRSDIEREMELKLILGSNVRGWNISENMIAVKRLNAAEPWEFGYAVAASRPLRLAASARRCSFCAERFQVGAEMYGGLGDRYNFGLHNTSQYAGPSMSWSAPNGITVKFSPQFGMNDYSIVRLYRFGVSYEIEQIFHRSRQ
jgi:hypothetical protein